MMTSIAVLWIIIFMMDFSSQYYICSAFTTTIHSSSGSIASRAIDRNIFDLNLKPKTKLIPPSSAPNMSDSALDAKFKLDNEEYYDDNQDYDGSFNYDQQQLELLEPIKSKNRSLLSSVTSSTTTTTFGSEAVPEGQRPANEYLDLISAPFFDWAKQSSSPNPSQSLAIRLTLTYIVIYALICWPISGATFTMEGYEYLPHKILSSHVGAIGFILVFVFRLYSGWGYIGQRLQSKQIEYEETGWYDGAMETKTEVEMARDLLLYRQDVQPVVKRLKVFLLAIGGIFLASVVGLNLLFQTKPLFNEYDPDLLERLVYDDKVANIAADQSGGIPTYCNSRYYRAVANGGQGCK